jgi:predicted DNA-binding protein with PD1-like motif
MEEEMYAVFVEVGEDIFEQLTVWCSDEEIVEIWAKDRGDLLKTSTHIFKRFSTIPYIGEK